MAQCFLSEVSALKAAIQQNGANGPGQAKLLNNPQAFALWQQADAALMWALGLQPLAPESFVGGPLPSVGIASAATALRNAITALYDNVECFEVDFPHPPMPPFAWVFHQNCCDPDSSICQAVHSPMEASIKPHKVKEFERALIAERQKLSGMRRKVSEMAQLPGIGRAPGLNEKAASAAKIKAYNELRKEIANRTAKVAVMEIEGGYGVGPLANFGKAPGHKDY
jgi:hypothetical protein